MAESLAHKFGQLIGVFLEMAIEPNLRYFANRHNLYLDVKGERKTRKGTKLTWTDIKNNKHDLDFVLERGGTNTRLGTPVAFIEIAWRRYTKHSRNKAQEIQGAILPLVEKYRNASPFFGVLLAGNFTQGSLAQLISQGFAVLYFQYDSVVAAFLKYGIDVSSDELTAEEEFRKKIDAMNASPHKKEIATELLLTNKIGVEEFLDALELSITRKIESIIIWPFHSTGTSMATIEDAITFLINYPEKPTTLPFKQYEIYIRYNTGGEIKAICMTKAEALDFLERHAKGLH
jgi:hypothetical protein